MSAESFRKRVEPARRQVGVLALGGRAVSLGPLVAGAHRRRYSATRAIARANIPDASGLICSHPRADARDRYSQLYLAGRTPGPIWEAASWVHARRLLFAMADIEENARRKAASILGDPRGPRLCNAIIIATEFT